MTCAPASLGPGPEHHVDEVVGGVVTARGELAHEARRASSPLGLVAFGIVCSGGLSTAAVRPVPTE